MLNVKRWKNINYRTVIKTEVKIQSKPEKDKEEIEFIKEEEFKV